MIPLAEIAQPKLPTLPAPTVPKSEPCTCADDWRPLKTASPWRTRDEVRDYFRLKDTGWVDLRLTKSKRFTKGKMRCRLLGRQVRIWFEDVRQLLKEFEG